jgi:hypothetical protein
MPQYRRNKLMVKVKVKFTLEQAMKAQRGSRGKLYPFFNLGAIWGGCSTSRPGRFTPGIYPVPIYRRLGGLQCRSRRLRKISPPQGFDPGPSSP